MKVIYVVGCKGTETTHIHIITSRIDPHGKKIDHNYEKRHSQEVIKHIMGVDESLQVGEAVSKAFQYHFSTVPQFTAILEIMGYECYTEEDEIVLKRKSEVQEKVKVQLVESKISQKRHGVLFCTLHVGNLNYGFFDHQFIGQTKNSPFQRSCDEGMA